MTSTPDIDPTSGCEDAAPETTVDGDLPPMLVIAADGTICHASPPALDLLGRDARDTVDRHISVLALEPDETEALLRRSRTGEAMVAARQFGSSGEGVAIPGLGFLEQA
jgi:hypothetical protein